jgi:hypothetical protein
MREPLDDPFWWPTFRRIVTFLLGCAVILDSLLEKDTATVGKLVVGLILVGVLPLEDLIRLAGRSARRRPDDNERS